MNRKETPNIIRNKSSRPSPKQPDIIKNNYMGASSEVPISEIIVENRYRKDLGDLELLAQSIKEIGLLNPITVQLDKKTGKYILIAGERRIRACKLIGKDTIAIRVIDIEDIIRGEFDENQMRKDFTPSEKVVVAFEIEKREQVKAEQRMLAGKPAVKLTKGRRDRIAAERVGWSQNSYKNAKAIVEAARIEPEKYSDLVSKMDETGKVSPVYKELQRRQNEERIQHETKEVKDEGYIKIIKNLHDLIKTGKRFQCIYIDPPWQESNNHQNSGIALDHIKKVPVNEIAEEDCHLHLWTNTSYLLQAIDLIRVWGFEYKSMLIWSKPDRATGNYWKTSHEILLLGTKGNLPFSSKNKSSVITLPVSKDSEKPEEIRKLIEEASPEPRIELFARTASTGWYCWRNEL